MVEPGLGEHAWETEWQQGEDVGPGDLGEAVAAYRNLYEFLIQVFLVLPLGFRLRRRRSRRDRDRRL